MLSQIFSHAQLAIVFLQTLDLVSDIEVGIASPEVADHRMTVFDWQVESLESGDVRSLAWAVHPENSKRIEHVPQFKLNSNAFQNLFGQKF